MRGDAHRENNPFQRYIDKAFTVADDFADQHSALSMEIANRSQDVQLALQECVPLGIELLELLKTLRQIMDSMNIVEYHRVKKITPNIIGKFKRIKQKFTSAKEALKQEPESHEKTRFRQNLQAIIDDIKNALDGLHLLEKAVKKLLV